MNIYEKEQFEAITKWEKEEPSILQKGASTVMKPIEWCVNKIIPQKAIQQALNISNYTASKFADKNDILRDGKVDCLTELKTKNLKLSDNIANDIHNWAIGLAATEGGICGYFGLPGMVADIPMIITFALRTIHKIGLCYGYESNTLKDNQFVYSILSAAGANTMKEKNTALLTLKQLQVLVGKKTWKKIAETATSKTLGNEAMIITIKSLAKQLGINLTKRKVLQSIPFIGAGVGAAMNVAFINDISWAARRCFQKRWLLDNKKILEQT